MTVEKVNDARKDVLRALEALQEKSRRWRGEVCDEIDRLQEKFAVLMGLLHKQEEPANGHPSDALQPSESAVFTPLEAESLERS